MNGLSENQGADEELQRISAEEERVLARVQKHVETRELRADNGGIDYDAELLALRDQINEARLEDIPPLIEEMERVAEIAARRAKVTQGVVDPRSPYFGRMVLEEDDRRREVLIGRSTYLHPKTGIRIVDWRDAPVSRLYYRYEEGDEYFEEFGGREVEGEVLTRRTLAINEGELRRIGAPQGTFLRRRDGSWFRASESARRLTGGQGAAMRAEGHHQPGRLGTGRDGDGREDRFLPEITALIDPRQFELITAADSGLVVIQGGAGSGKTTIGLHRLAYLNFQDRRRFRPDRMLVMVFNRALERYISRVLPALGVTGVPVTTYERWASRLREQHVPGVPRDYEPNTPATVTRLKKHPLMLDAIDRHAAKVAAKVEEMLERSVEGIEGHAEVLTAWRRHPTAPLGQRLEMLARWARPRKHDDGSVDKARSRPLALRHAVDRVVSRGKALARDVLTAWADLLTDLPALEAVFLAEGSDLSAAELQSAHRWCTLRCPQIVAAFEEALALASERDDLPKEDRERARRSDRPSGGDRGDFHARARADDRTMGIDGAEEQEPVLLDREDDTLLLRMTQRLWGPLSRGKERLTYEHMFLDEAQDLSPVELAVVVGTASDAQSVTLAGDVAQRLLMDNGFNGWDDVLGRLGLDHVEIEPLKLTYRSTAQIIDFADDVLGPLRNEQQSTATRQGAPVELFEFGQSGEAVAFLGGALRELMASEPRASVAVIARYPEHADIYYRGLANAEVPFLRRIAQQDFPFKPGIDVTDVRQVKGLEFDYVVLLEVSSAAFAEDDEARHLLHIAATRAAHQLWVTTTGTPSSLLPQKLRDHEE
ncbi:MAG: ATP-binding domain-containing protein [Sandaracinaceae bacterium]|nr:ATP-binding domain-containing protein [Sandaracinaceae bacterium]